LININLFHITPNLSKIVFMKKQLSPIYALLGLFTILSCSTSSLAIDLDETTRTVPLDSSGSTVILTPEQVKRGKRLFNASCGQCHVGGITKTNPNLGLDPDALSLATPPRDNINALIDYLNNPTSYDGLESIAELHPSTKSADIFPKMRSLSDEDLFAISGHILLQPKVGGEKWGGGKIYF
jgi:photosystem II cytochrome c550